VDINGGPLQTICDLTNFRGGTWNSDGILVIATEETGLLYRVTATGGKPVAVTKNKDGERVSHRYPHFLPDGRHFLFFAAGAPSHVFVGDLQTETIKELIEADTGAFYVPPGFLLFVRQGILLAQEFDAKKLTVVGDAKPVAEPVFYVAGGAAVGLAGFSASANGVLAYRMGGTGGLDNVRLMLVDRAGRELEQLGMPGPYRGIDLAPDGKRVVAHRHDGLGGDLWVFESPRPAPQRFTFDASQENASPLWSADGMHIAFGSYRNGAWGLYQKPTDGSGDEQLLWEDKEKSVAVVLPSSWSPDAKILVFEKVAGLGAEIWMLPLTGEKKPQPFLQSKFNTGHAQISPDGKWISYNSNESGRSEVYVRPFPSGPGRWQVSVNGGQWARWRPDGKEIYYLTATNNGKLMAVEVKANGSAFQYGTAKELFNSQYLNYTHPNGGRWHTFAASRDGQRFVIPRPVGPAAETSANSYVVTLNWQAALGKK
jgi:Tol biopolymer transport system component